MIFKKWLVNSTDGDATAEVQLIDGRIRVPRGGWVGVTDREADHEDVVQAIRRNWIKVVEVEPKSPEVPEVRKPKISNAADEGGDKAPPKKKKE
jgi:hypothetical protein